MIIAVQQLSALLALILGLSLLLNAALWRRYIRGLLDEPAQAVPLAMLLLVTGLLIVIYHNLWLATWAIAITLIGWLFVLKGLVLLLVPGIHRVFRPLTDATLTSLVYVSGITMTALGAFTCYNLFFA